MKTADFVEALKQQAAKTKDSNTIGYLVTAAEIIARMHDVNRKLAADRANLQRNLTKIRRFTMLEDNQ